jgi:preprotein translocase subunit YajC
MRLYQQQAQPTPNGQPAAQPQGEGGGFLFQIFPIALIIIVFYFIIIRPQMKQQRQRDELLKNLKKNDHVVTTGGIYGTIRSVKDNEVIVLIDEKHDVCIRVARSAVTSVEKPAGGTSDDKDKAEAPREEAKK